MTSEEALAWADKTMNDRLREARRTGTDSDYDQAMEDCIDVLAAEVRRLREQAEVMLHEIVSLQQDNVAARAELDVATSLYHTTKDQLARADERANAARAEAARLREVADYAERALYALGPRVKALEGKE